MAIAGCVNAYDCEGCYLTTLQQLQSDNVGVAINYTAPGEYGRRELDYIKYTDKCGCTCCLTGENELRIIATQGVIKNFTLTNEEDDEVVNIKWNDLFGGNRAKTIVRYKTGSYPTGISDGTLAVEETTKNQYSTNGYNVSGLTDGATYYFTAFAVDSNNVIITSQNANITADFGLPSIYQQLVYIQGTGSQIIDSGYTVKTTTKTQADFSFVSYTQGVRIDGYCGGTGSTSTSNGVTRGWYLGDNASKIKFGISNGTNQQYTRDNPVMNASTNRYLFVGENGKATINNIDGTQVATVNTKYTITQNGNHSMGIMGARDIIDNRFTYGSAGKLYNYKVWENGTLVCNFIPCYRISDGVIGLYDLKHKTFHTNVGSGTFVKGPEYKKIPNEYQQVEYIQTSATNPGATSSSGQYINTGYKHTPNTEVEIDYQYVSTATQSRMFGVETTNSSYSTFVTYINGSSQWARGTKDGEGNWQTTNVSADANRHLFILNKSTYKIYTNGSQIHSGNNAYTITKNGQYNMLIFATFNSGYSSGTQPVEHASAKLYYCKISESGTLKRWFVPCYRKSDNVIGAYDRVNGVFYTNSGSGTFTKGQNINKS